MPKTGQAANWTVEKGGARTNEGDEKERNGGRNEKKKRG